jgi:hypothetical protein
MQMEGLNFAIPAEFVSFSTIGLGTLFVLRALFIVLFDRIKGKQWSGPIALIPFTASVVVAFIGLVALEHIPYELLDSKILGLNLVSFVWSCFLIGSLAFALLIVVLLRWDSGPAKHTVEVGSITLLVVAVLGFIMFAAGAGPFVLALLVVSVVGLRWWYVT